MSAPFIFITTHTIKEGKLQDYMELNREFTEFLEANDPSLVEFHVYMNEQQTEVSYVHVFADADVADVHVRASSEWIGRGLAITDTKRLEVYGGTPGPVLEQALTAQSELGVPLSIEANHLGGFSRSSARA
jgi:hypothetical protein